MSLKLGTQDIAGISQNTKYNAHHLLDFKWTDCIMNDVSWLRADTFSWQSGDVFVSAYNHLVQDIQGITAETETIGSYTVTFYRATDGHKICLADQEQTVLNIYNTYGIAWYYILDTTNTQFKLPRTKYGFEGLRTNVGDKIDESLPNITGYTAYSYLYKNGGTGTGVFQSWNQTGGGVNTTSASSLTGSGTGYFNAHNSSSTYQDNAPVQERATQMYLYFYVGDYTQSAIEQTAGLNAELFNGKADINLNNVPASKGILTESYVNGTSWYRVYSDGWCEQGGTGSTAAQASNSVALLKAYTNTNYTLLATNNFEETGGNVTIQAVKTSNSEFNINAKEYNVNTYYARSYCWYACGYIN